MISISASWKSLIQIFKITVYQRDKWKQEIYQKQIEKREIKKVDMTRG